MPAEPIVANTATRVYAHAPGEHREQALRVLSDLIQPIASVDDGA